MPLIRLMSARNTAGELPLPDKRLTKPVPNLEKVFGFVSILLPRMTVSERLGLTPPPKAKQLQ
jgi:hypothetical protein